MATLTIRDLPDDLRDRLRVLAANNKRSMEAEARRILTLALSMTPPPEADPSAVAAVQDWVAAKLCKGAESANTVDGLVRDNRREVILEVVAEGKDPASYFAENFPRICREADWSPEFIAGLCERQQ